MGLDSDRLRCRWVIGETRLAMKKIAAITVLVIGIVLCVGTAPPVQAKPIAGEHTKASQIWMAECTTNRWFAHCLDDMRRLKSAGLWPW